MAGSPGAFVMVTPNAFIPEIILPYAQASGAFETLAGGEPMQRLNDDAVVAYIRRMDVRTRASAAQSAPNQLPTVAMALSMISAPTYLQRVRAEWDYHDVDAWNRHGVDLQRANTLAMRQSHFQLARNALLYGFNPLNGEGLVNTNGATAVTLPADSSGNTTVSTYDNGEMAWFLAAQINAIKTRTNQLGRGRTFVVLGPQRTLSAFEYQGIVSLIQYQRKGAGSMNVKEVLKEILANNEDELVWVYDDTLIGKGAGGTDGVIIVMPEVETQSAHKIDTNEFAKLSPGLSACTLQLCDMAAPKEIPSPLAGGATDVLSEWRLTSGWGVRPEAISILSLQYQ